MLKNKIVIIISGTILVLGLGSWYAVNLVKNKMYSQIMTYADSPEVRKQIEDAAKQLNENPEISNKIAAEVDKTQVDNIEKSAAAALQVPSKASAAELGSSHAQETEKTPAAESDNKNSAPLSGSLPANKNEKAAAVSNSTNSPAAQQAPSDKQPVFQNRTQAESFALQHFSASEITHYFELYKDRSSLTAEQKAQIKKEILSRFTPQEIQSMLQASKK